MSSYIPNIPANSISEEQLSRPLSVRAGAAFGSVAELLADTTLDYNILTAGDLIYVQGYHYQVAPASADDAHLATVGGIKLRVLPTASGRLSLLAFGADPTGIENCLSQLRVAALAANEAEVTLVATGRFKLTGKGSVVLTTDGDFSGAIFDCQSWEGYFELNRKNKMMEYFSGPVVDGLQSSTDLGAGSSRFSGWDQLNEVSDSFVIISTNQDFYSYRGETKKRIELNRVYKDGVLSSALRYPLSGVGIQSVKVFPLEARRRRVSGLTLDLRGNDVSQQFIRVATSLLDLDVRFIQDNSAHITKNPTYVSFRDSSQIKARIEMQWPSRSLSGSGYTYNIGMEYCYDIDIIPQADGDGWGSTGNNLCQRITFRDGTLSRIDFHQPFMEWLRLRNMVVGDWGILVTALGDLDLDSVTFHARTLAHVNNSGIIRSRPDTGGFCDGDLLMRNVIIIADSGSGNLQLFRHQQDSCGTDRPEPSPIQYRWWRRVRIDGLDFRTGTNGTPKLLVQPCTTARGAAEIATCEEFSMHNACGAGLHLEVNLEDEHPSRPGAFPIKLDLANVIGDAIVTSGNANSPALIANIQNCRGRSDDGIKIKLHAPGQHTIIGGCACQFDSAGYDVISIRAYGTSIVDNGKDPVAKVGSGCDLRCIDCTFWTSDFNRLRGLLEGLLIRPTFYINGRAHIWKLSNTLLGAGTLSLVHPVRAGQITTLRMGLDSGERIALVEVAMPAIFQRTPMIGFSETDGVTPGLLHRIDETTLEASGNVRFRYLEIGRSD
ncbi:hypothetical protein OHC51_03365 [Stenotrophomonas indicatrix]|uniref:hypothetical protein n=1 Tax=Stenotrophomonas indicatrix TaxID=2045451 RepID=UPI0030082E8E